ncbi:MAG: transglycosylase domain-containing protein [Persephonella sp.]|nr:transglycosylase domain-containing protein [Persephonella sp.]
MCLNQIYLGHGAYGVESASQVYFGKHVWELDVCEAAVLAGLPKAPSRYDPYKKHMEVSSPEEKCSLTEHG